MAIAIPVNDVPIPEANLNWVQTVYTDALLDTIDAHLEKISGNASNLWAMWEQEQSLLWGEGFDLVTAMGYSNVTLPARRKEFAYQRKIYQKIRAAASEAFRTKNLQLYISTKFAIEKQRQSDYLADKKLYQKSQKYALDAQVTRNEAELKKFEGQIEGESIRLKQAIAIVERVERNIDLAVKLLQAQGEVLVAKGRNELERQRLNVTLAKAALDVRLANLDAQRALVQRDLVLAEIGQLEAQVRVIQAEETVEEGRKYDILADIAVIKAQAREIEVLQEELRLITDETAALIEVANTKQAIYNEIIAQKQASLIQLSGALQAEIAANQSLASNTHTASTARLARDLAEDSLKLAEEDNRAQISSKESEGRLTELIHRAKLDVAQTGVRLAELASRAKINEAQANASMSQLSDEANLRAAESRARMAALLDRAKLDAAQSRFRAIEIEGQGRTQGASHSASMTKLKAEAGLTAAQSHAAITQVIGEMKSTASSDSVRIRQLLLQLAIAIAEGEANQKREDAKGLAVLLQANLQADLNYIQAQMDALIGEDKVKREGVLLDVQVQEAKAQKEAAGKMKDAHVENEITEIRK